MDDLQLRLEHEVKHANELLKQCRKVEETLATDGWKEIIEPLLDKMILDVLGGKINGKWYGGLLDRARKEERREFYIGYKQAMIDFNRRIIAYIDNVKTLQIKIESLKKETTARFKTPLVDDTRYGA